MRFTRSRELEINWEVGKSNRTWRTRSKLRSGLLQPCGIKSGLLIRIETSVTYGTLLRIPEAKFVCSILMAQSSESTSGHRLSRGGFARLEPVTFPSEGWGGRHFFLYSFIFNPRSLKNENKRIRCKGMGGREENKGKERKGKERKGKCNVLRRIFVFFCRYKGCPT